VAILPNSNYEKMGKNFVFNHETFSFEKARFTFASFLKKILPNFLIAITFGSFLGYGLFTQLKTPEQKDLEIENQMITANFHLLESNINQQITRLSELEDRDDNSYRAVLGLTPIPKTTRLLGYGGSIKFSDFSGIENSDFLKKIEKESFDISNRIKLESESYNTLISVVKNQDKALTSIPSIYPLAKKDIRHIGSGFGYRMHPILHVIKLHTGIDLSAAKGTPVYATGDGIVIRADASSGGYGKCIRINHGYSYLTLYAHLSKIVVSPGQVVKRGQIIGYVGSTGRSTGSHLHYEVRINGKPVNPVKFLFNDMTDEQYQMLIDEAQATSTF
jgi:murein DD-endopeptidase MepM/ murein hydrolase activator NlpD